MLKRVLMIIIASLLFICCIARAEYAVNDIPLNEYTVEGLYAIEDSIVAALKSAFDRGSSKAADGEVLGAYVINPRTKKFHYPYCYSALQIGADRVFMTSTPSELMAQGYEPCGQCKPSQKAK